MASASMKTPLPRPAKGGPSTSGPLAAAALAALLSTGTVQNAGARLAQASVLPIGTVMSNPSYMSMAFPTTTLARARSEGSAAVFPVSEASGLDAIEARAKELAAQEQAMTRLLAASKVAEAEEAKVAKELATKAAKEEAAEAAAAKQAAADQVKAEKGAAAAAAKEAAGGEAAAKRAVAQQTRAEQNEAAKASKARRCMPRAAPSHVRALPAHRPARGSPACCDATSPLARSARTPWPRRRALSPTLSPATQAVSPAT